MRPATLAEASERIADGVSADIALAEFLDSFYLAPFERQCMMLEQEPVPMRDPQQEALLGAIAEYLSHQYELPSVPAWAFAPQRYLARPWHTSSSSEPAMREYLTFSSPAEFAVRNIFTEEAPLRRARTEGARRAANARLRTPL